MRLRGRAGPWLPLIAAAGAVAVAACGGGGGHELVGYTRDPAPAVDAVTLPEVSAGGDAFRFRAPDDGLLVVYFGYTHCPDACPTAMANVRGALEDLDDAAARVEVAMVTVDPARDRDVLAAFVRDFVAGAHAVATDDDLALRRVADAFGVSYQVTERGDDRVEVVHTDHLFAVDDTGTLVLTWPSGTGRADLAADLDHLLDETASR